MRMKIKYPWKVAEAARSLPGGEVDREWMNWNLWPSVRCPFHRRTRKLRIRVLLPSTDFPNWRPLVDRCFVPEK